MALFFARFNGSLLRFQWQNLYFLFRIKTTSMTYCKDYKKNFVHILGKTCFKFKTMLLIWLKKFHTFNLTVTYKWQSNVQKVSNILFFQEKFNAIRKCYSSDNKSMKSSTCENSDTAQCEEVFHDKIIKWAIQNNISYYAFSQLLKVLSDYGLKGLPKNSKTLLKAKEDEIKVINVPPGNYVHFGLEKNLKNLIMNLESRNVFKEKNINVSIFIDNLPLSNATQRGLWVILGSVEGFTDIIFIVGAYHGYSRPKDSNLFLSEFVEEAKDLCTKGLDVEKNTYNVKIKRLICDAPAKAFVLNVKNFRGYSSCTKCNIVGEYKSKSICFEGKYSLKTDDDFKKEDVYKSCKTNLLEIPHFGVVSNVPLDYMHLVCLGVVKKLLRIWSGDREYWICENSPTDLYKTSANAYPCEFEKKPKPLSVFTRWSANEFRQFLLYYGPVALKNGLKQEYYDHFLLLHVACRMLCMKATPKNIECARELLNSFVNNYKHLYKTEQITHNVHGLCHLADDCHFHGTLDNFSSFSFEKFLLKLRRTMLKSKKRSLPQMILKHSHDRIFERSLNKIKTCDYKPSKKQKSNEVEFENFSRYERLTLKGTDIIPRSNGNNYVCLKNKKLVEVTDILERKDSSKDLLIAGKEFNFVCNFYSEAFSTFDLCVFKVGNLSDNVSLWPVETIDKKCLKISVGNEIILIGLLHENF